MGTLDILEAGFKWAGSLAALVVLIVIIMILMRSRVQAVGRIKAWYSQLHPATAALLEVGLMFLPAFPAYLWMWPNLDSPFLLRFAHIVTYVYVMCGTLVIGLRRYNLSQLGLNGRGVWLSLAFGLAVILGRSLVILSVYWGAPFVQHSPAAVLGEFLFYFGLVGVAEELLFRGLVYRALEDWLGIRWAIWGSSIGFALWHIFGQGPLIGAATLLYGLIFALIRWRAGSIVGLIIVHGTIDFLAFLMLPDIDVLSLGRPEVYSLAGLWIGLALIVLPPVLLWRFYPLPRPRAAQHPAE